MLDPTKLAKQQNRSETVISNAVPKSFRFMKDSIVRNMEYTEYSVVDVNFERMRMWGFTLYLWLYICRMISHRLQLDGQP